MEGGLRAAGDRGGVSRDDVDVLAVARTGALAGKTHRALDSTVLGTVAALSGHGDTLRDSAFRGEIS